MKKYEVKIVLKNNKVYRFKVNSIYPLEKALQDEQITEFEEEMSITGADIDHAVVRKI